MILQSGYLGELREKLGVPKWDCFRMGMVTGLGLVEDFVQLAGWRSSILGIAGLRVMRRELRFR